MADLNDDKWLDALAGREVKDMDNATAEELRVIRESLLAENAEGADDKAESEHAYQRLLFRLKKEGLLPAPESTGQTANKASIWRRFAMPLSAAAVLVLSTLVLLVGQRTQAPEDGLPPEVTMRGGTEQGPQVIETGDVDGTVAKIKAELDAAGVKYDVYPLGLKVGLEAALPKPAPADLVERLRALGIAPAADGTLSIEVAPRPSP